jgi:acyl-[acyl-carrier-protein]-phospholipid O-acyltransferase/long-chain-fatty-acid--[acyl-carrier-protein] ligase
MSSHVLRSRRFLPLFITQFLGALNDNFFKTSVVILVTYRTSDEMHIPPQELVTFSGALYVFPYMLFCATAGKLADKYDKARIAFIIKLAEVGFMCLGAIGFLFHLIGFLFAVLLCMGAHSAFFSPVKYALIPDQLKSSELMEGNAFIEAGTFIAILVGTIAGGLMVLRPDGEVAVSIAVFIIAGLGVLSSAFILPANLRDPSVKVRYNILAETWDILSYVAVRRQLFKSILANSWFWFVAMTFLTLLPSFTKQVLGADEHVVTLFLTTFSIGIGIGSVTCGSLLSGNVSTRTVGWAGLGMSLFALDLYWISPHILALQSTAHLLPLTSFLRASHSIRLIADVFLFSICGGFFIVPLYAVIQQQSEASKRAQIMASNNVMNAFFMVASAMMTLVMFACRYTVADVFLVTAILNGVVALYLFTPAGRLTGNQGRANTANAS